ncbi:MAG: hypothetical protein ACE5HI_09475 [bacterium]
MINVLTHKGKKIFYKYDEYQDALFLTFTENPRLSYYDELENGIMVRKDAETNKIIGYTVRNISTKIFKSYVNENLIDSLNI